MIHLSADSPPTLSQLFKMPLRGFPVRGRDRLDSRPNAHRPRAAMLPAQRSAAQNSKTEPARSEQRARSG